MLPAVLENHGGLRLRKTSGRCHPPCGHAGRPHSRGILPGRGVSPWFRQQRGGKDAQQPGELGRAGTKVLPTPARLSRRLTISWPTGCSLCLCACAGYRDEIVSELNENKSSASTVRDAVGGCSDLSACSVPPSPSLLPQKHLCALEPPGARGELRSAGS